MKNNKGLYTLIGFLLITIGLTAVALSIVGVKYAFLLWMDAFGPLFAFLLKIIMIMGGFVLVYVAQTGLKNE